MTDQWEYVLAAYGVAALALAVWFWMILGKLRRLRRASGPGSATARASTPGAAEATTQGAAHG